MISFNDAPEQKEGGGGPIPHKSIVKVKIAVREPSEAKRFEQHNLVTVFKSGLIGLDCEFEVVAGTYQGIRIWENWFLRPDFQNIALAKGQEGICKGSDAKMRAMIEASRGINPADGSPAATQARGINDWSEFDGMEFPVMVGIDKPKAGDLYINNNIMRVITPDREDYQVVMGGGEIISDVPIPEIPAPKNQKTVSNTGPGGGWGTNQQQGQQPPQPNKPPPPQTGQGPGGIPNWAQGNQ